MTIQSPMLIQLMILIVPLYVLGMLLPDFSRSTLFFGVTLPQEVHQQPELLLEKNSTVCGSPFCSPLAGC